MGDVTHILEAAQQGDPKAAEELLPLVYDELRRLAASRMSHETPSQTLQPTALVHEAWLRLVGGGQRQWAGRAHFFAAAAEAMRRILIERARRKGAQRHGGGRQRVEMEEADIAAPTKNDTQLVAVHDALDKLAGESKIQADVVKLRYFVGMTVEQTAEALGISPRSAAYYWTHAKAWLFEEIFGEKS